MRHIILHHHIFKNAGSTLDFSLMSQFGTGFAHFEDGGNPIHGTMLAEFLDGHPDLKAVSSHNFASQSFDLILSSRGYRAFNLAMVRCPLRRLISMYLYFRRSEPTNILARIAADMDLRPFARELIERHPYMIDSPQVNIIANDGFYGRAVSDDDLEKACARYATFSLCAPVERYDEAMIVLEYFNSAVYLPAGLDMAYLRQNVSGPFKGGEPLAEVIGKDNYDAIVALSDRDSRLWRFAGAELDRRIAIVPDFADRLVKFRMRCALLANKRTGLGV
jgi:hypothetical protein